MCVLSCFFVIVFLLILHNIQLTMKAERRAEESPRRLKAPAVFFFKIYVFLGQDRMGISKQELVTMLEEEELKEAALVVFANKQVRVGRSGSNYIYTLSIYL